MLDEARHGAPVPALGAQEVAHPQRAEIVGHGSHHLAAAHQRPFGRARAQLEHERILAREFRQRRERALDRGEGQQGLLRALDHLHLDPGRQEDPVHEGVPVERGPHGARRDRPGVGHPVAVHHGAVLPEDVDRLLDARRGERSGAEGLAAQRQGLRDVLEDADLSVRLELGHQHADAARADVDDGEDRRPARGVRRHRGRARGGRRRRLRARRGRVSHGS